MPQWEIRVLKLESLDLISRQGAALVAIRTICLWTHAAPTFDNKASILLMSHLINFQCFRTRIGERGEKVWIHMQIYGIFQHTALIMTHHESNKPSGRRMRAKRSDRWGFQAPYFIYTGLQFKAWLCEMLKRRRKTAEWAQIFPRVVKQTKTSFTVKARLIMESEER